jgi:DNA invertase Pin-like site-specific DNA recombinase
MIIGYCRVTSFEPASKIEAQERTLAAIGAQRFFAERKGIFGKATELERAIDLAQEGDVIAITRPYRIAISTRAVMKLIDRLRRKGVGLRILNTPVDSSTTTGRMILGSAPQWSLGLSPIRSAIWDFAFGWRGNR